MKAEEKELFHLREQRKGFQEELRKLNDRKERMLKEMSDLEERIVAEREAVQNLRDRLSELSSEKRGVIEKIREVKEELRGTKAALRGLERALKIDGEKLKSELEKMEWDLQTKPLDKKLEGQFLEKMKKMAYDLAHWKKAYSMRVKAEKLSRKLDDLVGHLYELKAEVESLNDELESRRVRLKDLIAVKRQLRSDLKGVEADIQEINERLLEVTASMKALQLRMKKDVKPAMGQETLEEIKKRAEEKLQKGKPLAWEEIQALYGDVGSSSS